jgi:hypothetical protein
MTRSGGDMAARCPVASNDLGPASTVINAAEVARALSIGFRRPEVVS